jgi:outer membrane biosynthesis protein TonB
MAQKNDRKILRIGIIQNGKIIEERLLRKRDPVTIGQSPRNTFVLPTSPFPRSHGLFELKGGVYHLVFKDTMEGRVSIEDAVLDFKGVISRKLADRRGDAWALPLSEKSRGKVVVGDVTLLFQFVAPPPPPSRLQLPANVKGGWAHGMDWPFTASLSGSLVLQVALVVFTMTMDIPEKPAGIEQLPDRIVQIITQPKPPKAEKADDADKDKEGKNKKDEEKVAEKPKDKPPPRPKVDEPPKPQVVKNDTPVDPEARKAEVAKAVASKTILSQLAVGVGSGSTIVDTLRNDRTDVAINTAFEGATGVAVADNSNQGRDRRARNAATGNVAGMKDDELNAAGASGTVESGAKGQEVQVKGSVKAAEPSEAFGTGTLDTNRIASTVKSRIGGVKSCYEKELKRNPQLQGKIVMQFTINEAGRVMDVTAKSDSVGEPAVAECIKAQMERWKFPAPDGGTVTVAFPFIFAPSN